MFDKGIRGYLQIFYKLIISFLFNTSNVQTETLFKIQTEKSAELTCCTGQYPEATHVWRECAVWQYLHTVQDPMTTYSPPSAGETEGPNHSVHFPNSSSFIITCYIICKLCLGHNYRSGLFHIERGRMDTDTIQVQDEGHLTHILTQYKTKCFITPTWVSQTFVVMICSLSFWKWNIRGKLPILVIQV